MVRSLAITARQFRTQLCCLPRPLVAITWIVKTQAPYAVVVMLVALLLGYLPVSAGLSVWLSLPIAVMAVIGLVIGIGRRAED